MSHHIKLFVVDGTIEYIHHDTDDASNDDPGKHLRRPTDDQVRFKAPKDGGFSIEFKVESPFVSDNGRPGHPIVSPDGKPTPLETLKSIPTVSKKFKYNAKLAGLEEDPEIIIDNGGGDEKSSKKPKKKKKK